MENTTQNSLISKAEACSRKYAKIAAETDANVRFFMTLTLHFIVACFTCCFYMNEIVFRRSHQCNVVLSICYFTIRQCEKVTQVAPTVELVFRLISVV
jgi:hypothetical protein